ncbi:MAG: fumarylacetoacetate hydrolase family protein [Rhizobium sp.]|nr:fumarylacetoacetate hydrolase family protein [Rhizobium sp.]
MKLATMRCESGADELVVVSRDLALAVSAGGIAASMLEALENWQAVSPALHALSERLENGEAEGAFVFNPNLARAPLPRSAQWLDASAFPNHGQLMAKAFGIDDVTPKDWPLMYQGLSDYTYAPMEDVALPSEADGIDFEGEFAVVVDAVPMGISPEEALSHIKLVMLVNDWSLRAFGGLEMRAGFGFIRAKPATAFGPVTVTPDTLGEGWKDGRVQLDLHVWRDGVAFGHPNGREMSFHFGELIAHAAYNRHLSAGTIIGSGTVSNRTYAQCGSACIAERRSIETIANGSPATPFLRFGERVKMEVLDSDGTSVFGAIDQRVISRETKA